MVGGKEVGTGTEHGSLAVSEIRFIPIQVIAPAEEAGGKADGQITLTATIGEATHRDTFAFRVFGEDRAGKGQIAVVDPDGMTSKMLADLGYATRAWDSESPLVVIGRNALKQDPTVAAKLEAWVRDGGRAMICAQDPQWMAQALGWRVCPQVSRRVFPMNSPIASGIDADDLRDWTGSSTLIEAYPDYQGDYLRGNERDQPYAGWHWGNRGGVTSAAIEKPHRSGWRPLLECEFDLAYTPLMELDYGKGRLLVCTLDLEDHVALDPAARRLAGRIIDYALHCPLSPRVSKVVYVGGAAGAAWLDKIGVSYQPSAALDTSAGLLLIGPDAALDSAALNAYLEKGGKAFFLPRSQAEGWLGTTLKPAAAQFRRIAVGARLARGPRPERLGSALALLPGHSPLASERGGGDRGGRPDRPQSGGQGRGGLLPGGPGPLPRGREDLLPLHALALHPRRRPALGQPGSQLSRRTAGSSIRRTRATKPWPCGISRVRKARARGRHPRPRVLSRRAPHPRGTTIPIIARTSRWEIILTDIIGGKHHCERDSQ